MSQAGVDSMQKYLGRSWGLVLAFALATVALGVVLLVWPKPTVAVIAVLVGLYLLVSGVFQLVASFTTDTGSTGMRVFAGISGALSIMLGVFAFRSLAHAVGVLALLVGFSWLFRGIAELVEGITSKGESGRGWAIVLGIIGILAGIVVLVWPIGSLAALAWVTGLWMIALGIVEVFAAFSLRKAARA